MLFAIIITTVGFGVFVYFWQYKCRYCNCRGTVSKIYYGPGPNSSWWLICGWCQSRWKPKSWCIQDERRLYHIANGRYPTEEYLRNRFKHMKR